MEQAIERPATQAGDEAGAGAPKRSRKLLWIVIAVVLIASGLGGWFAMSSGGSHEEAAAEHSAPPVYIALEPAFVVNFEADESVRFLQITVQLMTRDPATVEAVKTHDPVIRNDLLMLLGNQRYENVATRAGKEQLRAASLDTVRAVIKREGGDPAGVEALYFTSFVMQ
jgi:flagellar FliL protein